MLEYELTLSEAISKIKQLRRRGVTTYRSSVTSDIKFIPFLKRIKFFDDGTSRNTIISRKVRMMYEERIMNLPVKNEINY